MARKGRFQSLDQSIEDEQERLADALKHAVTSILENHNTKTIEVDLEKVHVRDGVEGIILRFEVPDAD